jgi:2-succinyl-6-hydroxy-2,4-cyclohexadiene-1-carboxylate synthase
VTRLALVHGFTQTSGCWGPLVDDLAAEHDVVALDAPGHGRRSHVRTDLWQGARLLAAEAGRAVWLGYSMGARYCLHVALAVPGAVEGMVLVGATAGIEDEGERTARVAADEALAARLEAVGLDAFLDEWLASPLFATLPVAARCLDARRSNTVEGLAASLRLAGTGAQEPLWGRLGGIAVPVLVVAGSDDERFVAHGRRLADALPRAERAVVPGAGHAAHLERPAEVGAEVRRWLAAHDL